MDANIGLYFRHVYRCLHLCRRQVRRRMNATMPALKDRIHFVPRVPGSKPYLKLISVVRANYHPCAAKLSPACQPPGRRDAAPLPVRRLQNVLGRAGHGFAARGVQSQIPAWFVVAGGWWLVAGGLTPVLSHARKKDISNISAREIYQNIVHKSKLLSLAQDTWRQHFITKWE